MGWPIPVHERLDGLVKCAVAAGEPTSLSRAELAAALICSAAADGAELRAKLEKFRLAKVRDVLMEAESLAVAGAQVISFAPRKPGRRRD